MKKNFFYYASFTVLAGLCLSWGSYHHHIRDLTSIAPNMISAFDPQHKNVEVHVRTLSADASRYLLGHNLPSKGIQPLHLTIENNSPYEYEISPDTVDLEQIRPNHVAKKLQKSSLPRSIAFKIMGFFFWPLMIPGTVDTFHTMHSYKSLKRDYAAKSLQDEIVPVYSVVNRILFVPVENLKESFTITLIETKKQTREVFSLSNEEMPLEEAT